MFFCEDREIAKIGKIGERGKGTEHKKRVYQNIKWHADDADATDDH